MVMCGMDCAVRKHVAWDMLVHEKDTIDTADCRQQTIFSRPEKITPHHTRLSIYTAHRRGVLLLYKPQACTHFRTGTVYDATLKNYDGHKSQCITVLLLQWC